MPHYEQGTLPIISAATFELERMQRLRSRFLAAPETQTKITLTPTSSLLSPDGDVTCFFFNHGFGDNDALASRARVCIRQRNLPHLRREFGNRGSEIQKTSTHAACYRPWHMRCTGLR
jgi:hypothetical protein